FITWALSAVVPPPVNRPGPRRTAAAGPAAGPAARRAPRPGPHGLRGTACRDGAAAPRVAPGRDVRWPWKGRALALGWPFPPARIARAWPGTNLGTARRCVPRDIRQHTGRARGPRKTRATRQEEQRGGAHRRPVRAFPGTASPGSGQPRRRKWV